MNKAKIFENDTDRLINALDIRDGKESKQHEFVDPEENFKVTYVKGAKHNGVPHFRLYMSHADYLKLSPERKSRFDILKGMDHFAESQWHRDWEESVKHFSVLEKYIKNPKTKTYKRADAFYEEGNTTIEFQHSYTSTDFKRKNEFYTNLSINIIWIFDLIKLNAKENGENIELLEDNARGFFKVSEEEKNLSDYPVFIQVKGGLIYKVNSLERKEIDNELQSTIRYFKKAELFTKEQFIDGIKNKERCFYAKQYLNNKKSIFELWSETNDGKRSQIIIRNTETDDIIKIWKDKKTGLISENYSDHCIGFMYCGYDTKVKKYKIENSKIYSLAKNKAKLPIWELLVSQ